MNVTLLATLCHLLTGSPVPLCTEEHVLSTYENPSLTPAACALYSQMILAQWKMVSRFAGDDYVINEYRCAPGNEEPRGRS